MDKTQELLDKIKAVTSAEVSSGIATAVEPLHAAAKATADAVSALAKQVETQGQALAAMQTKPAASLPAIPSVQRVDMYGRPVDLMPGTAPGWVKTRNTDSKPLRISNIMRGVITRNLEGFAPEEVAFSQRLKNAGYTTDFMGSLLFPLGAELFPDKTDEYDFTEIRKEITERLSVRIDDPGELGWIAKRFPGMVNQMVQQATGGQGWLTKADMQVGDDTLGGHLIPIIQGDRIIDLLRNRLTVMKAGATEIALPPQGNLTWIRLTEDPAPTYGDPDTTADATAVVAKLGPIRLQAKSLRAWVTIPNDLLRYSSPSVELLVRTAMAGKFAVVEDKQFLDGVGSTLAPKGIINYPLSATDVPAVGKITKHVATTTNTNGDTFEPEDVMKMVGLYYLGNDPDAPTAWVFRPLLWAAIANRRADAVAAADGKGPFMFWTSRGNLGAQIPDSLAGFPVYPSAQVAGDRAKGSGTTLSYGLFGNFRRLIIGRVGTLEIAVSEQVKFMQDKLVIRGVERHDTALEHEESFTLVDELLQS